MLAVLTTNALTVIEPSLLKRVPSSVSLSTPLSNPTASTWSSDNSSLVVSETNGIKRYDTSENFLCDLHESLESVNALVSKDKGNTLIYASGHTVSVLETTSGKITQTFDSHKSTVVSLSLSNDATLLASTSADAICIHNLTLASHTVLRGIPSTAGDVTTCIFHPHSRTRLLVGVGLQLAIYDTTRPSGPAKVIPMDKDKANTGEIVTITCSPFSKTLVAVGCSGGSICLVDLDKEKGLFRTLPLRVPLTSLVFSPEGASLYAGTESGKVLVLDLRALDKPPKVIKVSEDGERVVCMSIQKKLKPGDTTSKPTTKPLTQQDVNKATAARRIVADKKPSSSNLKTKSTISAISPPRTRTVSAVATPAKSKPAVANATGTPRPPLRSRTVSTTNAASSGTRAPSGTARPATVAGRAPLNSPATRRSSGTAGPSMTKKVVSPPRATLAKSISSEKSEGLDVSVNIESLLTLPKSKKENLSPRSATDRVSSASTLSSNSRVSPRTRTVSTTSQRSSSSRTAPGSGAPPNPRTRASSSASTTGRTRTLSAGTQVLSRKGTAVSKPDTSPIPAVPSLPAAFQEEQLTAIRLLVSRTPSPDLPEMDHAPVTPMPASKRGKGKEPAGGVLGLGTPEVHRWVEAGDGFDIGKKEGRRVGFAEERRGKQKTDDYGKGEEDGDGEEDEGDSATDTSGEEAKIEMTVQISPRRPLPTSSTTWAPIPSPLRNSYGGTTHTGHGGPSTNPAHDLLHSLISDALYDFRRETKAEIIGLHLDLVRMGRGWKKEMREAMDQWGAELKEMREDNKRLKEENERLRRGY